MRDHPVGHLLHVVDQVALGRPRVVEERLVEMGQRYSVARLRGLGAGHATTLAGGGGFVSGRRGRICR
jgi:hypothetical protein